MVHEQLNICNMLENFKGCDQVEFAKGVDVGREIYKGII